MSVSLKSIIGLLEQNTSLTVVSEFLRSRGLPHSVPSWEVLLERRLKPAIAEGKLSLDDLMVLLRNTEEFGQQHVFLFKCSQAKAAELMDVGRVSRVLKDMDLAGLLEKPRVLDQPATPTITDVRFEGQKEIPSLVIKIIERRVYQEYLGEERSDGMLFKKYRDVSERAVNVMRLHADGLLEIRIHRHANSSKYDGDIARTWKQIAEILPASAFGPISLSKAKQRLWKDRGKLKDRIRFSDSTFRNEQGNVLKAATGEVESDLLSDEGVSSSLDKFLEYDAECDGWNFWFKKGPANNPSQELHVLLHGAVNQFALTKRCSRADYEYALSQLRSLNG